MEEEPRRAHGDTKRGGQSPGGVGGPRGTSGDETSPSSSKLLGGLNKEVWFAESGQGSLGKLSKTEIGLPAPRARTFRKTRSSLLIPSPGQTGISSLTPISLGNPRKSSAEQVSLSLFPDEGSKMLSN